MKYLIGLEVIVRIHGRISQAIISDVFEKENKYEVVLPSSMTAIIGEHDVIELA